VITHLHADHAGGLAGALRGRGSPPIIVSPLAQPPEQVREVARLAASIGQRPVVGKLGMAGQSGAGAWTVHWRLLLSAPELGGASGSSDAQGTEINNASVVVYAQVRGLRVVALGDVEPEAQRPLIRTILAGAASGATPTPVDVVVVAHHGSARQEPRLYQLLRPRIALIGVGAGNDYGHPSPSALTLLQRVGAITLRTDRQGQLAVTGSLDRLQTATSP
jgi:competence protein ComEC